MPKKSEYSERHDSDAVPRRCHTELVSVSFAQ